MEHPDRRSYIVGFVLAVVLTVIPFGLVATHAPSPAATIWTILIAPVLQILVHLRWFLHIDFTTTPKENLLALAFTAVLLFLMVGGSFWIMVDLHTRMAL